MFPADCANRFQRANIPAEPRRSSPCHAQGSATGSGPVPIASRTGRRPGRHARSPSKDRLCGHESKTALRSADRAAVPPAPAATGSQSPSSCQCGQSPAIPAHRSEPESWQRFKPTHEPQQRLHVSVAIDNNASAVRDHNLDSTTARSGALLRLLRHDHRRHKSANVAKPPFAIRLAPGE